MNHKKIIYSILIMAATLFTSSNINNNPIRNYYYGADVSAKRSENQTLQQKSVPEGDTSFKSYMSYKAITNKQSPQYQLQEIAETNEDGLRMVDGYYCVAMGSYYAESIGDKLIIELEGGNRINVIIGDFKADKHTDETNRYTNVYDNNGNFISHNVVEFIVDMSTLDKTAKNWGDISAIEGFEGNISAIYKIIED